MEISQQFVAKEYAGKSGRRGETNGWKSAWKPCKEAHAIDSDGKARSVCLVLRSSLSDQLNGNS